MCASMWLQFQTRNTFALIYMELETEAYLLKRAAYKTSDEFWIHLSSWINTCAVHNKTCQEIHHVLFDSVISVWNAMGPVNFHKSSAAGACISNYIYFVLWDAISHPYPNC